mmetsp:Transcript_23960/g.62481  ORF Transcript_23960/g.62481 Transcript_23960/m.62481 type:complete len:247 (-) Transcript_23960:144-884(-)
MAPTRVLIFGATGGCGKHALSNLLDRGVQCVAVVRSEDRLPAGCKGKSNLDVVVVPEGHLSMDDGAFSALIDGADAVVSVLGHNITFKGLYGPPKRLCADTVSRVVAVASGRATPLKLIVVSTEGVDQPLGKDPPRGCGERALLSTLKCLLPPHADNMAVIDELEKAHSKIEFCAVRPADLVDGGECTYECHSTLQGSIFSGFKTHRANVGAFMADLVTDDAVWAKWKNSYPHCYDTPAGDKKGDY